MPSRWRKAARRVDRYRMWVITAGHGSNDEPKTLLAQAHFYNFSHFNVYPLTDIWSLPVVPPQQCSRGAGLAAYRNVVTAHWQAARKLFASNLSARGRRETSVAGLASRLAGIR
jgi:hypothetical protein